IGALAAMLLADNEKLTFVEGSVRQSVGSSLVEAAGARDSRGGMAGRFAAVAQWGPVNLSADALVANNFVVNGERERRYREGRFSLDAPIKLGHQAIAA